jgi:hypothetical protein
MTDEYCSHGPVSTLPGSSKKYKGQAQCLDCEKPATRRVQGETDSYGCEYIYFCDEHYEAFYSELTNTEYCCDGCGEVSSDVRPWRDPEEGNAGSVYMRCSECILSALDRFEGEY